MRKETLQLGMNYSAAQHRLKKKLMFSFIQAAELDTCFRCGQKLLADDFSLDHKEQWLGDTELFWDLNNVAFSHNKCNSAARKPKGVDVTPEMLSHLYRVRVDRRKNAPEGTSWCAKHLAYLPVDKFGKDRRQVSGFHFYCKECRGKLKY